MIRNYIITAYRNIVRQKAFSLINIFGLATAMAAVIFIFLWVRHELSYDRFHENAEHIYRIEEDQYYNGETFHVTVTPWPSGPVWQEEIPEIELAARYAYAGSMLFRNGDISHYENYIWGADSTFFRVFDFRLLEGDPLNALSEPNSIVLTKKIAEKYFGNDPALGQQLQINNQDVVTVTGILEDLPKNTTFYFDMLLSFDYMVNSRWYSEHWGSNSIQTFVMVHPDSDIESVNEKVTDVVDAHKDENTIDFMAKPLTGIHLYSYFGYNHQPTGIQNVYIFIVVGLFVLIIACINFMNLTTARSASRAKEIGLRKVNGAFRKNLVAQFLSESLVLTAISMILSVILVLSFLKTFNSISGKHFTYSDLVDPLFLAGIVVITIITGTLAGMWPAAVLSSLKPVHVLKGSLSKGTGKGWFRKISVTFQFILTILLIIGSVVIYRQLTYMQNKNLGYDKENLVYVPLRGELRNSYEAIKNRLIQEPSVVNVTATAHPPHSIGSSSGGIHWDGKEPDLEILVSQEGCDFGYVETMKIKMKEGRAFSEEFASDTPHDTIASFMINEELAHIMNKDEIIGTQMSFMGYHGPVVGVMENYHYQAVQASIEPLAMIVAPADYRGYLTFRLASGNVSDNIKEVEKAWDEVVPDYPFDYHFVDQEFDKNFRTEQRMSQLMKYFAIIAVIIACVGLFGLAAFAAEQKTREIGIRKALGANVSSILILFSREFVWLMIISAIIAWPLAWYFFHRWLENFSYRTDLNAWIFILSGLMALLIALISISYQAVRAARTNPAITLKYE